MRRILNDLKIMILANLWIVPVMAALVWALFQFVAPPPPMSASMATGTQGGAYQHFAERLKEELAKEGFELTLVPTSGSRDNLQRLLAEAPEVQIALVQSRAPSSCTRMPGITTPRGCRFCSATCRFASPRWPIATSSC